MRRKFNFSIDEYYHLYNRGVDKRIIFNDTHDYNRFILLLHLCNSFQKVDISNLIREGQSFTDLMNMTLNDRIVDIGAYCLMPNHFHFLVKERIEGGVSIFMKKLLTAYSMYFNKKHTRTGRLFESAFQAVHVDKDEYLKYLFSYIHLNPVKLIDPGWKERGISDIEKAKTYLEKYKYSSYLDYFTKDRLEQKILNKSVFPSYFLKPKDFTDFIKEWLTFKNY